MARDAIQQLLDQLLAGVMDDSAASQMASGILAPFMRMASNWLVNSLTTGTSADIRLTDILDSPTVTSALQSKGSALQYSDTFGRHAERVKEALRENSTKSFFRALGYTDARARHERYSLLGRALHMGSGMLGRTTWDPGIDAIGQALHSRRHWMTTSTGAEESLAAQVAGGQSLMEAIHKNFLDKQYGTLSMKDVGMVVQRAVSTGAFDRFQEVTDAGDMSAGRAERISSKVKSTSRFMERLKDVFSGDLSQLLSTMDQIFGGNALNMSEGRLSRITRSLQHMALITGTSEKSWREMGAIGYSYVAPHGGTTGLSATMANTMAYYNAAGISVDGLTQREYTAGLMATMANQAIQGTPRLLAAAYRARRDAERAKGRDITFRDFVKGVRGKGGVLSDDVLMRSIEQSVEAQYGNSQQTLRDRQIIVGNYIDSELTTRAMEEYNTFNEIQRSRAVELDTVRQNLVIDTVNGLGLTDEQKKKIIAGIRKNYNVGDAGSGLSNANVWNLVRREVSANAAMTQPLNAQLQRAIIESQQTFNRMASTVLPGSNPKIAEQFLISTRKAYEASQRALVVDKYASLFSDERLRSWRGARGFEGLIQQAFNLPAGESLSFAKSLAAWSGIDMNAFKTPTKAVTAEFLRQADLSGKTLTDAQKKAITSAASFEDLAKAAKDAGFTEDEYSEIFSTSFRSVLKDMPAKYAAALQDTILPFTPNIAPGTSKEDADKATAKQFADWSAVRAAIKAGPKSKAAKAALATYLKKYGASLSERSKLLLQTAKDTNKLDWLLTTGAERKKWETEVVETDKVRKSFADIFEQGKDGKLTAAGVKAQNEFLDLGRKLRSDDDNRALVLKAIKSGNRSDLGTAVGTYGKEFDRLQKLLAAGDRTAEGAVTAETREAIAQMMNSVISIGSGPMDMVRSIIDGLKSMVFKVEEVNK